MKDKFGTFINALFIRAPNKFKKYYTFCGGFNKVQGLKVNEGHIWDFYTNFFVRTT